MSESVAAPAAPAAAESAAPVAASEAPKTEAKAEAKPEAKVDGPKFKVKVDGKEMEVSQDDLLKGYQKVTAADKRMQEAAEEKKAAAAERAQVQKIVAAAKAGDEDALREAGLSEAEIEQLSIKVLSKRHQALLEEERRRSLDPKQREVEDQLKELEGLKSEKKKAEEAQTAQRVQAAKQQLSKAVIDTMGEFPESIRRNEALAQNVFEAWAYCVQHPDEAKELGIEITPKGIATAIKKRQRELAKAMIESAADDELAETVSESIAAKILAKKKAAAEKAAHPSLTSQPQVRGAEKAKDDAPRKNKLRELTLGSLGIK